MPAPPAQAPPEPEPLRVQPGPSPSHVAEPAPEPRRVEPDAPRPAAPPPAEPAPRVPAAAPARPELRRRHRRPRRSTAAASPGPGPHGRRRAGALLAVAALLLALWAAWSTLQPLKGDGDGRVVVTVPRGAGAGEIGDLLAGRGVVSSALFFSVNATVTGRRDELRSGTYALARGMSNGAAISALGRGPAPARAAPTFSLTIPEGRSRREAAPLVRRSSLRGSYLRATARPGALGLRRLGAPRGVRSAEGFLFPATYELRRGANVDALVRSQLRAFGQNLARIDLARAKRGNLTRYDVLTIASMVERETSIARERPLVAAVIYNRLRQGIPLGIDATIRYGVNNWSRPLRVSELDRDGPYNTRTRRGLPPTPIGNPGLASLRAAARPADVSFLNYVVKPGTCGEHAFSSTEAKRQRDVARYDAERAKRGGRSPTSCPG